MRRHGLTSALIIAVATLTGIAAFAYPFISPAGAVGSTAAAHAQEAPLLALVLSLLCLTAVVADISSGRMSARNIAVLGVLSAVNAVLRAIPGPAGFSAIFFLLCLCGYVYGSSFGFLLGVLSLLVSALIGGGVGPWLPYQMFTAGWMGLSSGWLPDLRRRRRVELLLLAIWTALWGFVFGAVMNLWFWPYISPVQAGVGQTWEAGLGMAQALRRYAVFYVTTSLWWDAWRALGNAGLILFLGPPLLRVLRRFERVLGFEVVQYPSSPSPEGSRG